VGNSRIKNARPDRGVRYRNWEGKEKTVETQNKKSSYQGNGGGGGAGGTNRKIPKRGAWTKNVGGGKPLGKGGNHRTVKRESSKRMAVTEWGGVKPFFKTGTLSDKEKKRGTAKEEERVDQAT